MWSVQSDKIKQHKKRVNYTIKNTERVRQKLCTKVDVRLFQKTWRKIYPV